MGRLGTACSRTRDLPPICWSQYSWLGAARFYRGELCKSPLYPLQLARGSIIINPIQVVSANLPSSQATSGTAEILIRTGGFSTKVLLHRLFETFQWVLQCTDSITSIQPGGAGHTSTIRVRLLHGSVRQRIVQLTSSRSSYYDADGYGVPINTLDSIHAISLFYASAMWQSLPRQGIWPRADEIADYIALFRYLGHLTGTPPEYFDSPSRAKAVMESMLYYEMNPSATGKILGHNFVECLRDVSPMNISREFIEAGSRWLNGDEICDAMGMRRPGLYHSVLMAGHCMLNWGLCWAQRTVPALDRWIIAVGIFRCFAQGACLLAAPFTTVLNHSLT